MPENETSWHQLSERVDALTGKLRSHLEQSNGEHEIKEALHEMKVAVNDALQAAGSALKDDEVRQNVKEIGQAFADAFTTTVTKAATDLREKVGNVTARNEPPAGETPPEV